VTSFEQVAEANSRGSRPRRSTCSQTTVFGGAWQRGSAPRRRFRQRAREARAGMCWDVQWDWSLQRIASPETPGDSRLPNLGRLHPPHPGPRQEGRHTHEL